MAIQLLRSNQGGTPCRKGKLDCFVSLWLPRKDEFFFIASSPRTKVDFHERKFHMFIDFLTTLPPESILCFKVLLCGLFVLASFRFLGLGGLYMYTIVATLAANLAVLKQVQFAFHPHPIAVGTVIFTSLFLCSDVINEYYGKKAALKNIYLGFGGYFIFSTLIFMVMGYQTQTPLTDEALKWLFVPAPIFLVSSLTAYFISQYTDVLIYRFIYQKTGKAYLWARALGSTVCSSFLDNTIFSLLAWYVLSPSPLPLQTIFWTYILGASVLRVILSFVNTGFMCLTPYLKPKDLKNNVL